MVLFQAIASFNFLFRAGKLDGRVKQTVATAASHTIYIGSTTAESACGPILDTQSSELFLLLRINWFAKSIRWFTKCIRGVWMKLSFSLKYQRLKQAKYMEVSSSSALQPQKQSLILAAIQSVRDRGVHTLSLSLRSAITDRSMLCWIKWIKIAVTPITIKKATGKHHYWRVDGLY